MDGWGVSRLLTAAEISGNFVSLRLALTARATDPFLYMQVVLNPDVQVDENSYARWSTRIRGPVPAVWDSRAGNPWRLCRYAGSLKTSTAAEFDQLIDGVSAGGKRVTAGIVSLIDAHLDGTSLALKDRQILLNFLKKDFVAPSVEVLVRPEDSDDSCDLTLLSAQEIHRAIAAGEPLTPAQLGKAEMLLKYAPWSLGYWGPFKAVVKAAPVAELADAYADAIARLSSNKDTAPVPANVVIDHVDELSGWFGIPTKKTRQYLARRVRRDLTLLAKQSPDAYARVASRMLIAWDEPLSNCSYAPAFVMLGARSPLTDRSRYVRRPADMAVRRDAHPEIWNERPKIVANVFRSVRSSVEALTWACQVLDDARSIPKISTGAIALALDSSYLPLARLGCEALPARPVLLEFLTDTQWTAFFRNASEEEIAQVVEGLATKRLTHSLGIALSTVFASAGQDPELRARLALLYLAAPKMPFTNHADADVEALIAAISGTGTQHQALWGPVVARMGPWSLAKVYWTLANDHVDDAALEPIATALVGNRYHPPDLVLECIGSDNPRIVDLGWQIVTARGGRGFFFTQLLPSAGPGDRITPATGLRAVTAALPRAEEPQEISALIDWALSVDVNQSDLAELMSVHPMAPEVIWFALGTEKSGAVSRFAKKIPQADRIAGAGLTGAQLADAKPAQVALTLRYIKENPSRIAENAQLGVDAFKSTDLRLRAEALRQLRIAGHLPRVWLDIAETESAEGLKAAGKYLDSLKDADQLRDAILQCLTSNSRAVEEMGVSLYRTRDTVANDPAIVATLAAFKDQSVQDLVAEAAETGSLVPEKVLQEFDRQILTDRHSSRAAKESVRRRIETSDIEPGSQSPERVATLLQLARGAVKQDREWALMRLAALALHGVDIEGLEVSLTTEGMVGLEDVAP